MSLSTQPYKGARDFYPNDKRIQNYMFNVMSDVVERFGYEEYDAPILEPLDLYAAKTGEEIVNEQTYTFTDRGDRKVAIRPEMTPSVSRMVAAKRQELAYPVRLFNIGGRWRYERPQRGRYREFFQLDVDIFGVESFAAEHELIEVADAIMQSFGAKRNMYSIKLNSRKLMDYILGGYLELDKQQIYNISKLIDRMNKIEPADFKKQAEAIVGDKATKLIEVLNVKTIDELPDDVATHDSVDELENLMELLGNAGIDNAAFDISVMRGFDYYTDIVFEVFDESPDNNRSMFGGGRYDGLVGLFGVDPVPTVGFAMGDATLQNFLESNKLLPEMVTETDVYAVLIGDVYADSQKVIAELRQEGVNIAVDPTGRKLDKQVKTADKKGIKFVLFIGEQELADGKFNLKDLETGQETKLDVAGIVEAIAAAY